MPVEAQAAGVPVIAYGVGGAWRRCSTGSTGVLFAEQSADSLARAIERFEELALDGGRRARTRAASAASASARRWRP